MSCGPESYGFSGVRPLAGAGIEIPIYSGKPTGKSFAPSRGRELK